MPRLKSVGVSQRNWKTVPAKAERKIDGDFKNISKQYIKILRHVVCHEADGAVR